MESWEAEEKIRKGGFSSRRAGRQDGERSEATTHDSLMGTKMKSFWNRSTCRVHVFTLLCFLFWILPMENHRIKHPNGATRQRRDLRHSRQVGGVRDVPPLPLVQPLVEEGAEHVDLLCVLFFQFL